MLSSGSSMAVLCLAIPGIVTMHFTSLVHSAKLPCLMSSPPVFSSMLMVRQKSSCNTHVGCFLCFTHISLKLCCKDESLCKHRICSTSACDLYILRRMCMSVTSPFFHTKTYAKAHTAGRGKSVHNKHSH